MKQIERTIIFTMEINSIHKLIFFSFIFQVFSCKSASNKHKGIWYAKEFYDKTLLLLR